ncbi:MAG: hypothetical protein J2P25_15405 [Nocardiopsaceae bacterium]|nr:hypothetical protein [Nocardiopsaceae bacterium]
MQWDEETRGDVEVALNEADVLGIRLDPSGAWCDLLLHVLALPEAGPLDPDARRILRLTLPAQLRVLLRADQAGTAGHEQVIPLADLDAVEEFFASLSWSWSMYGWKFFDDPSLTHDWPTQPSLTVAVRPGAGSHSLYWFNECGRKEGDTNAAYCIEGTVTFEDLEILRADATPQPLSEFIAGGRRYWQALHSRDARLSVEAQRAAQDGTPSWRSHARDTVTISGSPDPGTGSDRAGM